MSPARRRFVVTLILVLVGAHYAAIVCRIDEWPLSCYGMFAKYQPPRATWYVLYGVTPSGEEVRLQDEIYWSPYKGSKLGNCLRAAHDRDADLAASGEHFEAALPAAVQWLANHYESRRAQRLHAGPPLAALRLYNVSWRLEPTLANLQAPDRREPVYELAAPH